MAAATTKEEAKHASDGSAAERDRNARKNPLKISEERKTASFLFFPSSESDIALWPWLAYLLRFFRSPNTALWDATNARFVNNNGENENYVQTMSRYSPLLVAVMETLLYISLQSKMHDDVHVTAIGLCFSEFSWRNQFFFYIKLLAELLCAPWLRCDEAGGERELLRLVFKRLYTR